MNSFLFDLWFITFIFGALGVFSARGYQNARKVVPIGSLMVLAMATVQLTSLALLDYYAFSNWRVKLVLPISIGSISGLVVGFLIPPPFQRLRRREGDHER